MISFVDYLAEQRSKSSDRDRMKAHVNHHNDVSALHTNFQGEELDKAKKIIHNHWRGRSKTHSMAKFRKAGKDKWGKLWSKVRAECSGHE